MTCTTACTCLRLNGSMRRFIWSHCTQVRTQADVSNLRRLLGKAGPERSFDVMKESWRNSSKALILSTTTNCWISMPTVPNYGSDTQVHDRIRPWSFVWKCFRQVCWSILRKDYLKLVGVAEQDEIIERMRKRPMRLALPAKIKQVASITSKQWCVCARAHSIHVPTCVVSAQHLIQWRG